MLFDIKIVIFKKQTVTYS